MVVIKAIRYGITCFEQEEGGVGWAGGDDDTVTTNASTQSRFGLSNLPG